MNAIDIDPGLANEGPRDSLGSLPVSSLKGVGPHLDKRLRGLGLHTVRDLLFHLPTRYQDRTRVTPIHTLRARDHAVIVGEIKAVEHRLGRRSSLVCQIQDGTGLLILRFFHFTATQRAALAPGQRLRCFGEVRDGPYGREMVHPEYRTIASDEALSVDEHLTPIYPAGEGLSQPRLRQILSEALERGAASGALAELLPPAMLQGLGFPLLGESLLLVHQPRPDVCFAQLAEGRHPAQRRLAFEELLAHQLGMLRLRTQARRHPAPALVAAGSLRQRLLESLPFALTSAQRRVFDEIRADLTRCQPMLRLLQGDVGSGKTVIAALAAVHAVESGFQVAVMAPTELLVEQHQRSFERWLAPLGVPMGMLSGRVKGRGRQEILNHVRAGEARVVLGTHALFQGEVAFADLGLVIVDEQQRFGVHQRLALQEKGLAEGRYAHQLIITATPIPRTLAMTAYADLDHSVLDELPPGRVPVTTVVVPDTRRAEVLSRVRRACREGRQVYWVCTLIEDSEVLQCQAAEDSARVLAQSLPEVTVGLVHGRMSPADRAEVMNAFQTGAVQLLVATTVIEVGVDVPNASLMIIENAERLGLSQLHQLRGRVGRGTLESHCVLLYRGPLSAQAHARLGVLRESSDGFEIARRDLELRGPGELLGTRQAGMLNLRVADLTRHRDLLPQVRETAAVLLRQYPERVTPLLERWFGAAGRYAGV